MRIVYPKCWVVSTLALLVSGLLSPKITHAHLPVQVRGVSRLDADIQPSGASGVAVVSGILRDELGEPLVAMSIRMALADAIAASAPLNVGSCSHSSAVGIHAGSIATDKDGQFCATIPLEQLPSKATLRVVFDGSPDYVGVSKVLTLDDWRTGLNLEVAPHPFRADLDRPEWSLIATLSPLGQSAIKDTSPLSVEMSLLENGKLQHQVLQRTQMQVGVPTPISVPTRLLRSPGPANIHFAFDGTSQFKPFETEFPVERTVSVYLQTVYWQGKVTAGGRLSAKIRADSVVGPPTSGFVEVLAIGSSPRLFPVSPEGMANISLPSPKREGRGEVAIRYQSSVRGWGGTSELRLPIEVIAPSKWIPAGWAALTLLVLGWFTWSRRRVEVEPHAPIPPRTPRAYAHVEMIEAAQDAEAGWSGVIVDAHDAVVIGGAAVELRLPAFDGELTLFSTVSDAEGQFVIPAELATKHASLRLEIHARGYAGLGLQLPSPGRVKVFLVSVRRALLERFVGWTKRRGPPYASGAEPTPDWVASIAETKGHREIENWAKAVAAAAFGQHAPPDADAPDLLPPTGAIGAPAGAKRNKSLSNG